MEIAQGRIPLNLNDKENTAIDKLLENHDGTASLTRRDPGNSGPVVVEIGDESWEISDSGKAKKVNN